MNLPVITLFACVFVQAGEGPSGQTNGVRSTQRLYTTEAYNREALRLVLNEANDVARELQLEPDLPISESNLIRAHVVPYALSLQGLRGIGVVETTNYAYSVAREAKLCYINATRQEKLCFEYQSQFRLPISQLDTNAAYSLARTWLTASHIDVHRLNKECTFKIGLEPLVNPPTKKHPRTFCPVYYMYWQKEAGKEKVSVANVRLCLPIKKLLALNIDDEKYNLRSPIQFTNLDALITPSGR